MLVFFMAFPFGRRAQRGGLLADALEVLQIFVDEGAPLLYAVHTAQRVGGGVEGEVQQFVDGGRSYMETGIAGCIINIHAAVIVCNRAVFRTPWAMCSQPFSVLMGVAPSPFFASVMVW